MYLSFKLYHLLWTMLVVLLTICYVPNFMIQLEKLEKIYKRYKEIEVLLADPDVSTDQKKLQPLMKEYTECKVGVSFYRQLRELLKQKTEYNDLIHEDGDDDFRLGLGGGNGQARQRRD